MTEKREKRKEPVHPGVWGILPTAWELVHGLGEGKRGEDGR
jgi:hypothetical protein